MLFIETLNMESLVLMTGAIYGDVNFIAAQVIVVNLGEFMIMIPYGIALGAVAMIGNSLGANKPKEAIANTKMVITTSIGFAVTICCTCALFRTAIIETFSSTEEVNELCKPAFFAFCMAFIFDFFQNTMSGVIKAVG